MQLGELNPGEQLRCGRSSGQTSPFELQTSTVLSLIILNQPTAVYNIEVHGEHVYQVGQLGVFVHNSNPLDCALAAIKVMTEAEKADRLRTVQAVVKHLDDLIGSDELPSLALELKALSRKLVLEKEMNALLGLPLEYGDGIKQTIKQIDALLPFFGK